MAHDGQNPGAYGSPLGRGAGSAGLSFGLYPALGFGDGPRASCSEFEPLIRINNVSGIDHDPRRCLRKLCPTEKRILKLRFFPERRRHCVNAAQRRFVN
jgi:hypothetical protein